MKIHIDNQSRLDIADVSQIVTDLLRREREFMLANTGGGCCFKACGVVIAMLPVCREYPAGRCVFMSWMKRRREVNRNEHNIHR